MLYRNTQNNHELVEIKRIDILTEFGEIEAGIYYDLNDSKECVIPDAYSSKFEFKSSTNCPIDIYSILHEKLDKRISVYFSERIATEIAIYLKSVENK